MITPVEIQNKTFKSGGLGYDKKDVDSFIKEVQHSYEEVYRENLELKDKLEVLNQGIQYYKTMEKTLQKALILAEKTAEETRSNAVKDAKRIEKEATAKAGIMLADARNELDKLHQKTIVLLQQYEKYKVQFKNLAASQIELLDTDAFKINIQRLDAFVTDPLPASTGDEVGEISDGNDAVSTAGHIDAEASDFDFGDFQIDGQEEFDFLDLQDDKKSD